MQIATRNVEHCQNLAFFAYDQSKEAAVR
jgi:hypothetical protein